MAGSTRQSKGSLKTLLNRKMSKRREKRRVSMELPDRFNEEDDEDEDVTANPDKNGGYIQQSLYGLIGAAGHSEEQFGTNFQPDSGSESEGGTEIDGSGRQSKLPSNTGSQASSGRSSLDDRRPSPKPESSKHRKNKLSESTLLKQFLKPIRERSGSQAEDPMTQSQFLPPRESKVHAPERPRSASGVRKDAPVLDRMLQAKARAQMEASTSSTTSRGSREGVRSQGQSTTKAPVDLPTALAEIFHFEEAEDVISEYPCWYLQSVLLQGYMYITKKHVCFYAYMQKKKDNVVVKSGHLGKQGSRNPQYRRYWFVLKGEVLTYFASAADPYFPKGAIDLRYGISADLAPEKGQEKSKEASAFTVTTDKRTYYFRADSITSAKEWVKQLQKVIFRSHNDGDSVKISLPLVNVVDVEVTPMIDYAETIKLRVIDNDETYSVDEYFFSFFSFGKDALNLLNILTEDNEARKVAVEAQNEALEPLQKAKSPPFRRSISVEKSPRLSLGALPSVSEPVRSTLSPLSIAGGRTSPRVSGEYGRSSGETSRTSLDRGRASFDRGRRSVSTTSGISVQRQRRSSKSPLSPAANQSNESFVTSSEQATSSPTTPGGGDQIDMSASQMLTGDGAFRAPTLQMPLPRRTVSGSTVERLRRESQQTLPVRAKPVEALDRAQPPPRAQTDKMSPSAQSRAERKSGLKLQPSSASAPSRPSMQVLATPLQHAYTLYGHVRSQSKRGISYLSSSPKDYLNKFSSAMAGGKRHYSEADGLATDDRIDDPEDEMDAIEHERRFQQHFALPESERLVAVFYCWLHRVLPLYGKVYIGTRNFCFRSLMYGTRTRIVIPIKNIDNLEKERGFRWGYPGMVVVIRGHEELFFDFSSNGLRDDCVVTVLRAIETVRAVQESVNLTDGEKQDAEDAAAEHEMLQEARKDGYADHDFKLPQNVDQSELDAPPILFDDPNASMLDFKPKQPLRITCLTIGSRGDVQPYIALCKGLLAEGHKPRLATHHEFGPWVERHGIEFMPVEGDPTELMRVCVENGMFTPSFLFEANSKFRGWLDTLLNSAYEACKGSDLLIESPSAMAGIHIAEALDIPYFRAFTMPWTRTRAYPHAFAVPNHKLGGAYNYVTYTMFDNLFWQVTAGQINRWRRKTLGLKPTSLEKLQPNKVPFLYNFSPSVVVPPLDFSDWVRVTGYWFLDEGDSFKPPDDLMSFITKARKDDMKLVYIGFGSVTVSDSRQLTQQVVDAVQKADVRCILSKGWSDRLDKADPNVVEVPLPPSVFQIRSAPHDWLFKQIDAAVHHGGAGTTGASLRAGVPTIIKPFFGDQFFFATRVEDLGVGVHMKKVTVNTLGRALWIATHDERMRTKARVLGEQIRREDGVATAINAIYRDLDYAKTLIKRRNTQPASGVDGGDEEDAEEESWTFVENDSDFDVAASRLGDPAAARPGSLGRLGRQTGLASKVLKGRLT
ncbi:hypothetical protein LTR85_009930 [Meristemomyces frigidus]|nr:hypothetical protein LTR85_009930 [Meristemomyces frigidus]